MVFPVFAESEFGKTYVISIGINSYPLPYGNLRFAASDAEKFADVMNERGFRDDNKQKQGMIFVKPIDVILLSDQNSNDEIFPSKSNILKQLDSVLSKMNENDFVIIFFSGHGTGESLATTTQEGKPEKLELKEILRKLDTKAERYMLLLDACRYTENRVVGFSATIQAGNGLFKSIFYSTSNSGFSEESPKFKQGVYTHYLLEALKGKADTNKNWIISSDEVRDYVSENVKKITDGRQTPQWYQFSTAVQNISYLDSGISWQTIGKSAIIPGFGQWGKEHKVNSLFFFSSFLAGGFYLYTRNNIYERTENEYYLCQNLLLFSSPKVLDAVDLVLFQEAENHRNALIAQARNLELGFDLLAVLYLWNLWDAGFEKQQWFGSNNFNMKIDSGNYKTYSSQYEQRFRITTEWSF